MPPRMIIASPFTMPEPISMPRSLTITSDVIEPFTISVPALTAVGPV